MKTKFITATVIFILSATSFLSAQVDPHFSQYYANPQWLNPGLTGVINGDVRINANYKNQWANVNNAYRTGAVSVDMRANDRLGIGLTVFDQSAGGSSYNQFYAYGSASYAIPVSNDGNQRLSFGMQAGVINRNFDLNDLQFGNQFSPGTGFDAGIGNMENLGNDNSTVFDANAGLFFYDGDPNKNMNLFGGISASHLTRPDDPFSGSGSKIPVRYTAHGGLRIKTIANLDLIPNFLFIKQQKASIKALGAYSEWKFQNDDGIILGGMYRFDDAAIANLGYHMKSLILGMSYDFNTSSLTHATRGQGGVELSLSYVFRKKISGPEPICPRL